MNEPPRSDDHAHAPATLRLGDLEVKRMGFTRQVEQALERTPIVAVQNMFNISMGNGAAPAYSEVDDPHLEQNWDARRIALSPDDAAAIADEG